MAGAKSGKEMSCVTGRRLSSHLGFHGKGISLTQEDSPLASSQRMF